MSVHQIEIIKTPLLEAREAAVGKLATNSWVHFSGEDTWSALGEGQQVHAVGKALIALEEQGLLTDAYDTESLFSDLEATASRSGRAEHYKEGITGLAMNHVFAALARNGYIKDLENV